MRDHLIQGPRNKNEETRFLELLIQDILKHHAEGKQISVSYNAKGELLIEAGDYHPDMQGTNPYNLTDIL
ncbi:MAG TPA: hypothetical protein VLH77_04660, partial [Gammaproteobacteria bacterium]|nr:hypothetical protein [Gammaproteobacteria bacterium]